MPSSAPAANCRLMKQSLPPRDLRQFVFPHLPVENHEHCSIFERYQEGAATAGGDNVLDRLGVRGADDPKILRCRRVNSSSYENLFAFNAANSHGFEPDLLLLQKQGLYGRLIGVAVVRANRVHQSATLLPEVRLR